MNCEALREFRQQAYKMLGQAKDATFELMDAVMTTPKATSLTEGTALKERIKKSTEFK
ncbi:hypothetical protein [Microcoleus vaginatus]|uniref:hypothetical protein n=1 Tax=Microcoleus vaginatus TaxID=119532 RepID=UPI0032AC9C9C